MTLMELFAWLRLEGRLPFLADRRLVHVRRLLLPILFAVGSTLSPLAASALGLPMPVPSAAAKAGLVPGMRQDGLYVTMPVTVDGVPVIRIASELTPPANALPIDMRALLVENAISQVLAERTPEGGTNYNPATFKVGVAHHDGDVVLEASDANHQPVPIITVTSIDAQYNKLSINALAMQWQRALQTALVAALEKRQPSRIRQSSDYALLAAVVLVALTALGVLSLLYLGRRAAALAKTLEERRDAMEQDRGEGEPVADASEPKARRRFLALAMRAAGPEQRLSSVRTLRSSIVWFLVLLWAAGITWGLLLFPQTTATGQLILRSALSVAFIWIGAALLDRIAALVIGRVAQVYSRRGDTSEDRARHVLRAPTITRALGGFKSFAIVFIAFLATASAVNIPVASVVTIGGIAALAISFAAQNLVRDVFNGLLVLFEDQYVVGDYVMIGDYNGIVENLTLRVVQLRDGRGHLVTIPHSAVVQVVNASRNWSRVDYRVAIDSEADLKLAVSIVADTLKALGHDRRWRPAILMPLEWIGVETISKNAIVVRASVRTAPLRQFEVRREINDRVFAAFSQAGITLGNDPLGPPVPPANASPDPT